MQDYVYFLTLFNHIEENPTNVTFHCDDQGVLGKKQITVEPNHRAYMVVISSKKKITLNVEPADHDIRGDGREMRFDRPKPLRPVKCDPQKKAGNNHWEVTIKHLSEKFKGDFYETTVKPLTIQIEKWDVIFKYRKDEDFFTDPPVAQTPVTATDKQ